MDRYEFVRNLFDNSDDITTHISVEDAVADLEMFRREWGTEVPEDLTPEEFAEIWNQLVDEYNKKCDEFPGDKWYNRI